MERAGQAWLHVPPPAAIESDELLHVGHILVMGTDRTIPGIVSAFGSDRRRSR